MAANRQKDAHEKIMLGGLVVKAGLRNENPAFILGVLLTAFEQKDNDKLGVATRLVQNRTFRSNE